MPEDEVDIAHIGAGEVKGIKRGASRAATRWRTSFLCALPSAMRGKASTTRSSRGGFKRARTRRPECIAKLLSPLEYSTDAWPTAPCAGGTADEPHRTHSPGAPPMDCLHSLKLVSHRPPDAREKPFAAALAVLCAVAAVCAPAAAVTVHADFFAFADNGAYIDGDAESSTTRSRAVVDSGFVHQPIYVGLPGTATDWVWHAKASASLATGTLRTYAFSDTTASGATPEQPVAGAGWRSQASAKWADVVTFAAPATAPAGAEVPVTFKLDVRGHFAGFYATMKSTNYLMVNGKKSQVDFSWDGRLGPSGSDNATATTLGTVTGLVSDPRQLHGLLEVTVPVTPGFAIGVTGYSSSKAAAGPYASATSDFDHTATLSIDMPAGYTFTSQSGVLLSVPEPSTWLSVGAGLGLIAAIAARRGRGIGRARRSTPSVNAKAP